MDWFQHILRKCSQIVLQKIELSGTGQGMATLAALPASTPWALGHDSAKVAFSVLFQAFGCFQCWLLWIEMREKTMQLGWKICGNFNSVGSYFGNSHLAAVLQLLSSCADTVLCPDLPFEIFEYQKKNHQPQGWWDVNPLEYWLGGLKFGIKKKQNNAAKERKSNDVNQN